MSPSARPATQSAAKSPATNPVQARHQSRPSALSATPATQNEGGCRQVPLPRETKADAPNSHLPRKLPPQNESKCHELPPLPRERKADVAKCRPIQSKRAHHSQPSALSAHACHENDNRCRQVPRLPCETKADVAKCHAKCRGVTGDQSSPSAPPEPAQCSKCHACHEKRK